MSNCHDRGIRKLWVSQKKLVIVPHGGHFKRTKNDLNENENEEMEKVAYASVVGSLIMQ